MQLLINGEVIVNSLFLRMYCKEIPEINRVKGSGILSTTANVKLL
jgi:hypothetical protein